MNEKTKRALRELAQVMEQNGMDIGIKCYVANECYIRVVDEYVTIEGDFCDAVIERLLEVKQ